MVVLQAGISAFLQKHMLSQRMAGQMQWSAPLGIASVRVGSVFQQSSHGFSLVVGQI